MKEEQNDSLPVPVPGFSWMGINVGIRDNTLDFGVLAADVPCNAAGVFTRSNLPGAPVIVGRKHLGKGKLQAVVVNSKCANVATGQRGLKDAHDMCRWTAEALAILPELVLPSSTGVIGEALPIELVREGCSRIPETLGNQPQSIKAFARAIMTTDTHPKWSCRESEGVHLLGVAKGAGMIEPDMATMLSYFVTDARFDSQSLQSMLKRVVDRSFNRISIDSDTSTSDTVVILANGSAGETDPAKFEEAFSETAQQLARTIARDGEGATKLIELRISGAYSREMALRIGKSIINSPLVKTAIHGADPNWGRFVMAVGKVFEHPVQLHELEIRFGTGDERQAVSAEKLDAGEVDLHGIRTLLERDTVPVEVVVGNGEYSDHFWGCDLSKGYVEENAFYTT